MSVSISVHRLSAAQTRLGAIHARAVAMANSLVLNYYQLLAACTDADQVSDLLHTPPNANPRLTIETMNDTTVRVSLRNDPKDIPLLTIHARP